MNEMIAENRRRNRLQAAAEERYDPVSGEGCVGERVTITHGRNGELKIPREMTKDKRYAAAMKYKGNRFDRLRIQYDFEFWAYRCVTIQDKRTGREIAFRLNVPQRRVLARLENMRTNGQPIRIIILKARQWGGSTLVQVYMAWIQIVLLKSKNSFICSHLKDTSRTILEMYRRLLSRYPKEFQSRRGKSLKLESQQGSNNIKTIAGRDCTITIGSSESPEASRGSSLSLAHLSEVSFWKDSKLRTPEDSLRAIVSGIPMEPMTLVAMESTANGVGSFFHREWVRSESNESAFEPIFVPWYEIGMNRLKVTNPESFVESLNKYEKGLWEDHGLSLEQINWYRHKCKELGSRRKVMSEYPTTALEAFSNTGNGVFAVEQVERLRQGCLEPIARGDMGEGLNGQTRIDTRFIESGDGRLSVWEYPDPGGRYVVSVDVGGRSESSDWSVICVMKRGEERPEVVAQWVGHTDHDLLAWKAASMAQWYNRGLLIIESNTLETESYGQPSILLAELSRGYGPLYYRDGHAGFHTNIKTKATMIMRLIGAVRDGGYVERDQQTCNELIDYEQRPNGSYGARKGRHDDRLMSRALALTAIAEMPQHEVVFDTTVRHYPLW